MPSLTPVVETSESLAPIAEGSESLAALAESTESLVALTELTNEVTPALPALYPSPNTYPSAALTYPSLGTPEVPGLGLALTGLVDDTQTLTPLGEA